MAKVIQEHTVTLLLTLGIIALLGAWLITTPGVNPNAQGQSATPQSETIRELDAPAYSQLMMLRSKLALTNRDLAAMGCTGDDARRVLLALADWRDQHGQAIDDAERTARLAKREAAKALRQIHLGPRNEALLTQYPALRQTARAAEQSRDQVIAGAAAAIDFHFTADQRRVWTTARANRDFPTRYRYVAGLSDTQLKQINETRKALEEANPDQGQFALADQQQLMLAQQTDMAATKARITQHLSSVASAVEDQFPIPEELAPPQPLPVTEN